MAGLGFEPHSPGQTGALAGIRVLDLSRVLGGPYCTQILGDHGADVLKIEPPGGDETRAWGPPFRDGTASYYLAVNRNKRTARLDLSTPQAQQAVLGLLSECDVVVENFRAGTMEKWGLGPQALQERFPRLVYCRVTGFGETGPMGGLPAYDTAVQAMVGLMSLNGPADGGPCRVGFPVIDLVTGMNAALGVMMALQERQRSGRGQYVEAALYDSGISLLHPYAGNYFLSGQPPARVGNAHSNIYPYDVFDTATVPIYLAVGNDMQFERLMRHLGRADVLDDPRFGANRSRSEHRAALRALLAGLFQALDGEPLAQALLDAGVPCSPVLTVEKVLAHPQTAERAMVARIGEHYAGLASPIKLGRTPASYRIAPA
ncbi:CoA-transferase family III protein [Bordetella bronchiseptica E014]|uniref:CaiB/BaiF CoA transferase family protein n=1 Tax=Bordetella bronchiseptica TaxID=518 RepID=UPI00028A94F1|nr:CoA transferase [Bordetella bronchiseptica]KCV30773.1 CoA-transferase family III protein [Bordetella bronchiseptica 00-P-2730]AZW29743.1 CoA transferase [Bordetella bronchiseptica]KCV39442.1 CoA-transferase family III protein [Bordetella bronchiseptica 345]KDC16069.1 CoA-transferase family III protein [Bordetella bronchiseptica E014]KDC37342.1 CoA-transferase family III protein [Bordetella bronchiseptica GA96-01]